MELGIVLLYVGAVLVVNGIWLVGEARAAAYRSAEAESAVVGSPESAPAAEAHPTFIRGREVSLINVFTGFIGVAVAVTLLVRGSTQEDLGFLRGSGFILLFAFTYLWVAANQFLGAGAHAFGWYCLFVAVTALGAGTYQFIDTPATIANVWLGVDWFAWAVLWFLFWGLLSLEWPIAKFTGYVAIIVGIGTSWAFGFALLQGRVAL
jgi:hypothetical protein